VAEKSNSGRPLFAYRRPLVLVDQGLDDFRYRQRQFQHSEENQEKVLPKKSLLSLSVFTLRYAVVLCDGQRLDLIDLSSVSFRLF
jgi:hypothetical protein